MQQPVPPSAPRVYVVGCDAKQDIRVFSGITYHLANQGVEDGLLTGMVNLYPRGIRGCGVYARAGWWKLRGGIHGRHGFIFTDGYLDSIWKRTLRTLQDSIVINNFQLFGSYFRQFHRTFGIAPYTYIDTTLGELFANYGSFDHYADIEETTISEALDIEREGYAIAHKIVVMSKRSADYLVRHYNVPRDKICMLPPGANIPERLLVSLDNRPERCPRADWRRLVIGFIGLDPERKGLPTIADGVELVRRAGYDVRLHVIGKCPPEISRRDGVTHYGLIDKSVHMERFLEIVRNVDLGCMLSRAESAGIALLEFLRLGIPIIATDVGGIPDIVNLGAGQLVSPEIRASDLAEHFARLLDEPERLAELHERAWSRRQNASWRRVVRELKGILNQPPHRGEA
jgi:glycosyltransferase involved in cell wall biosynthesis